MIRPRGEWQHCHAEGQRPGRPSETPLSPMGRLRQILHRKRGMRCDGGIAGDPRQGRQSTPAPAGQRWHPLGQQARHTSVSFHIFTLQRCPERAQTTARPESRRRGGVSDREVKHEKAPIQVEAEVWPFTIVSAELRNWAQARLTKERHQSCRRMVCRTVTERRLKCLQTIK